MGPEVISSVVVTPLCVTVSCRIITPHAWTNVSLELKESSLRVVEHVVANITLRHHERRLLNIYIVSPSGE